MLLLGLYGYSQDIIYFDSNWKKANKNNHSFYRLIKPLENNYIIEDYYKSGILQMKGMSKERDPLVQNGEYRYFDEKGSCIAIIHFENNKKNGNYKLFYPSGNLKEEGTFIRGNKTGENIRYFDNGFRKRISKYKRGAVNGIMTYYNNRGIKIGEGPNKDGYMLGMWKKYYNDGSFMCNLFYTDNYDIEECHLRINTSNTVWQYFEKEKIYEKTIITARFMNYKNFEVHPKKKISGILQIKIIVPDKREFCSSDESVSKSTFDFLDTHLTLCHFSEENKILEKGREYKFNYFDISTPKGEIRIITFHPISENKYCTSIIKKFLYNLKSY